MLQIVSSIYFNMNNNCTINDKISFLKYNGVFFKYFIRQISILSRFDFKN